MNMPDIHSHLLLTIRRDTSHVARDQCCKGPSLKDCCPGIARIKKNLDFFFTDLKNLKLFCCSTDFYKNLTGIRSRSESLISGMFSWYFDFSIPPWVTFEKWGKMKWCKIINICDISKEIQCFSIFTDFLPSSALVGSIIKLKYPTKLPGNQEISRST